LVISEFLENVGKKTIEAVRKSLKRVPRGKVEERLRQVKELQREAFEFDEEEKVVEEVFEWRREEIDKPLSKRLEDAIFRNFKGPLTSITRSFKGLDEDLFRAGIYVPKERYFIRMFMVGVLAGVIVSLLAYILYVPLTTSLLVGALGFIGGFGYMRYYPKMVWKRRVSEVERALPYALRHMAALLSAGIGIEEAIVSIARSDYGVLSEEFGIMVREMRTGTSFEEALQRFEERMRSDKVSKVVKQILRVLKFGGNLSEILYKMAEDFSFEYRMKLVEYVQKVNGISFIYLFLTIIMPTMFVVAVLAGSLMSKRLVLDIRVMAIILLLAFPSISFIVINMIKNAEPR